MRKIIRENTGLTRPGHDLVVAGHIGIMGTKTIISEKKEELLGRFTGDYLEQAREQMNMAPERPMEFWADLGATEYEPVKEGGILTALWNLSGAYETGIRFYMKKIPISQITIEVCEHYQLNPYRLMSGNCALLAAENGGQLVERLAERQIFAAVIGRVEKGIKREILDGEAVAYLDRPVKDELYKVVSPDQRKE